MKGKSLIAENMELAFQTYRACGGNVTETVRRLEAKGFPVSRQTLYGSGEKNGEDGWIKKFRWDERMAAADAEKQRSEASVVNIQTKFLADLIRQKEKYDAYFDSITDVDNQAMYAYTNLVKIICEIDRKKIIAKTADEVTQLTKNKGLSEETAAEIREKILGIGK